MAERIVKKRASPFILTYVVFESGPSHLVPKLVMLETTHCTDIIVINCTTACITVLVRDYFLVSHVFYGVGGAVRFLVVGTIGEEERPRRQLWMEQCLHRSNIGLSSTEQIPIIFGVRPIAFWRAYGLVVFPLLKLLSFFWLTYHCSIGLCSSVRV